jgi:hypothetical protein
LLVQKMGASADWEPTLGRSRFQVAGSDFKRVTVGFGWGVPHASASQLSAMPVRFARNDGSGRLARWAKRDREVSMMMKRLRFSQLAWSLWAIVATLSPVSAFAQSEAGLLRDGFESEKPAWRQEKTDNQVRLFAHDRTNRSAREGNISEHFQFEAGVGSGFYFSYGLPQIPVTPNLQVSLHVKSDRPGVQILAKVILPKDVDPETNAPSFVLVPGTILETPDRWSRIEILEFPTSIERQARVLRATTKRKVPLEGAYVDRLVVNLYGGAGATDVYLDDLKVMGVPANLIAAHEKTLNSKPGDNLPPLPADDVAANEKPASGPGVKNSSAYQIDRNRLTRQGFPWLFTAIRAPGADTGKLRRAGFDLLALPADSPADEIKEAADSGMGFLPEFEIGKGGEKVSVERVQQILDRFPNKEAVAFWSLGQNLGSTNDPGLREKQLERAREIARMLRKQTKFSGLSTGEVSGQFSNYSRRPDHLDLIGVKPFGWGTTQEPSETFEYLRQRANLTALENADTLFYAWLPMSPARIFKEAVWGRDRAPGWGIPQIQPEQLRQSVFAALSAGYRGIGFDATNDITMGSGRQLLIEAALLNEEIDLFEWLLADTSKTARMLPTYKPDPPVLPTVGLNGIRNPTQKIKEVGPHPSIRAAAFTTKDRRGSVLLVTDFAGGSQFQPPQMALKDLKIEVPAQADAQAYEISPGDVKVLDRQRVPGGVRITIPEFGPTSIVYITTDGARISEIQAAVVKVRPLAVNLLIEQAQLQYASALEIHRLLVEDGHTMPEGDELLKLAVDSIKSAQEAQERQEYSVAWSEARRATRPLLVLMRYQWDQAAKAVGEVLTDKRLACGPSTLPGEAKPLPRIISPVSVPPLVSWNTLPKAWIWKDWIAKGRLSKNLLPSGDFENADALKGEGWNDESYQVEGITSGIAVSNEGPGNGKRALKLSGTPTDPTQLDQNIPFQDHAVAAVRTPPIDVKEAEMIRISVMVSMPFRTAPGAGGLIIRDSLGGETLQYRTTSAIPGWQEVVLYRRVPADGKMTLFLGYAGLQSALFDNIRIQKIIGLDDKGGPPVAETPARPIR